MFDLLTLKEFSKEMKKPESTIRTWRRRGNLPEGIFLKIGGDIFIKIEEFKKWVAKNEHERS